MTRMKMTATKGLVLAVAVLAAGLSAVAGDLKLLSQGLAKTSYTTDSVNRGPSGPEKAFDGVCEGTNTAWCNGPKYPTWLMVDLGDNYNIIKTMTYVEKPHVWYGYKIEVSADKQTWTVFADQSKNTEPCDDPAYTDMGEAVGRYVRITLTDVAERARSWYWPVLMEFQVYGIPAEKKQ